MNSHVIRAGIETTQEIQRLLGVRRVSECYVRYRSMSPLLLRMRTRSTLKNASIWLGIAN